MNIQIKATISVLLFTRSLLLDIQNTKKYPEFEIISVQPDVKFEIFIQRNGWIQWCCRTTSAMFGSHDMNENPVLCVLHEFNISLYISKSENFFFSSHFSFVSVVCCFHKQRLDAISKVISKTSKNKKTLNLLDGWNLITYSHFPCRQCCFFFYVSTTLQHSCRYKTHHNMQVCFI